MNPGKKAFEKVGEGENAATQLFTFSYIVLYPEKLYYPLPHNLSFLCRKKAFENIIDITDNAGNKYFLLFPPCFPPSQNKL